jgi:hypothetical protein
MMLQIGARPAVFVDHAHATNASLLHGGSSGRWLQLIHRVKYQGRFAIGGKRNGNGDAAGSMRKRFTFLDEPAHTAQRIRADIRWCVYHLAAAVVAVFERHQTISDGLQRAGLGTCQPHGRSSKNWIAGSPLAVAASTHAGVRLVVAIRLSTEKPVKLASATRSVVWIRGDPRCGCGHSDMRCEEHHVVGRARRDAIQMKAV